jgi:membrane protease YdiL (CAAX protease family)
MAAMLRTSLFGGSSPRTCAVMPRATFLRLEWCLSVGLVALAVTWAWLRGIPLAPLLRPYAPDVAAGVVVATLLWASIPLLRAAPEMARVWQTLLVPFSRSLTLVDVVMIALLSGVSEELFFRGVLLPEIGLVASSALFGLLHALNRAYAIWAALTGAVFGVLAVSGGSLVGPIVAHALYNFGALLVLRRSAEASVPRGART